MFQLVGFATLVILALYGALYLGWLPPEWAAKLPHNSTAQEMQTNIAMPYQEGNDPEEPTFTERVTGEKNPNRQQ
jgi:hypothetical protein